MAANNTRPQPHTCEGVRRVRPRAIVFRRCENPNCQKVFQTELNSTQRFCSPLCHSQFVAKKDPSKRGDTSGLIPLELLAGIETRLQALRSSQQDNLQTLQCAVKAIAHTDTIPKDVVIDTALNAAAAALLVAEQYQKEAVS